MTDVLDDLFGFDFDMDIVAPEDPDSAVVLLPATQFPYGNNCVLTREWQSILFHYGVKPETVVVLAQQDIVATRQVRFADPDGQEDSRALFGEVCAEVPSALQRLLLKRAFRRMLLFDPFAAIVATPSSSAAPSVAAAAPPAKKVRVATDAAVVSTAPAPTGSAKAPAKKVKSKAHDISDSGWWLLCLAAFGVSNLFS